MAEKILDMAGGAPFVERATDPVSPNASTPTDFDAQYPKPLDTTELLNMAEEVNMLRAIPEISTGLKHFTYREMDTLGLVSGSSYLAFADGACPEPYEHDGDNFTVTLKNIGVYKALTDSDIMHSMAVKGMSQGGFGVGIESLGAAFNQFEGLPGVTAGNTRMQEFYASMLAQEIALGGTLVLNGEDKLLVKGNASTNSLEFSGIETMVASGTGAHVNTAASASGTFSAQEFDRFLAEGVKPTMIFGHPQAIQEMMSAYFQLGYQGSQLVNHADGSRIVPGFNFAGEVNTGVGTLTVVADSNFTKTDNGDGTFDASLYPLRMSHNGEPLVFRATQIPLSFKNLAEGCTSIQFTLRKKTALVVKAVNVQSKYSAVFSGRSISVAPSVGVSFDL